MILKRQLGFALFILFYFINLFYLFYWLRKSEVAVFAIFSSFKVLFQEKKGIFVLDQILGCFFFSRDESRRMNQSNVSWLFKRKQTGVKCFCPEFCVDDNWSCFLEFIGSNYDQIRFCGIHIPSHFPTTHPPFQPSIAMDVISFYPRTTTQENEGLRSGASKQSK